MGDLTRTQQSQPVQITDDSASLAALSTGPAGTEVGLIVRNIPYGTQTVSGTVTVSGGSTTQTVVYGSGTFPVSGTITNVPSGTQTIIGTLTAGSAAPAGSILAVQGVAGGVAQPVSGTVTNVPSGTQGVSLTNSPTVTAIQSGTYTTVPTGTQSVAYGSGTFPVSGTVTNVPSGTQTIIGTLTAGSAAPAGSILAVQGVAGGVAQSVSGTVTLSSQTVTLSSQTVTAVGGAASGVGISGAPVLGGGRAAVSSGGPAVVTDGQAANVMFDKQGRMCVANYVGRDNVITTVTQTTTTTAVTLFAAQAGVYLDISTLIISNGSATAEVISLSDGTTVYKFAVLANTNYTCNFFVPLKSTSTAAAWTITASAAASTIYYNAVGIKTL